MPSCFPFFKSSALSACKREQCYPKRIGFNNEDAKLQKNYCVLCELGRRGQEQTNLEVVHICATKSPSLYSGEKNKTEEAIHIYRKVHAYVRSSHTLELQTK